MEMKRIKVWDLPTRIVHWALVAFGVAAVITGKIGGAAIDWHGRIGLSILGLIVFRLAWGLVGSTHARFASFFPTYTSVRSYLRGEWRGTGHNPLGAFSVFAMLALIVVQFSTGLFANDDIAFNGPLFRLVDKDLSDRLTGIHTFSINLLIAMVVLHIAAIAFYTVVKKDKLVAPMITGWKEVKPGDGESARGGGLIALLIALFIAGAAVYGASGAWIPTAPPVPTTAPPPAVW